eukprot:2893671-Pyramimonas_sp.AAC.1
MPAEVVRAVKKGKLSRSLSRRAAKKESSDSRSPSHSPQRFSMSPDHRERLSSSGSSLRSSDRTRTRNRKSESDNEDATPARPP